MRTIKEITANSYQESLLLANNIFEQNRFIQEVKVKPKGKNIEMTIAMYNYNKLYAQGYSIFRDNTVTIISNL